ncbi:MAG: hypothetical protein HYX94_11330 [Chloroflexi bacterium]|nr:hypothetical protein [Chloroflexota bacterium]
MGRAAHEPYDLAGKILAVEAGGGLGGLEQADAAERACGKLRQSLVHVLGSDATQLLVKYALSKTAGEFPFLQDVEVDRDCRFRGLRDKVEKRGSGEVRDGLVMMLAKGIGLLNDLIGEDLVCLLLGKAWPEIFSPDTGS